MTDIVIAVLESVKGNWWASAEGVTAVVGTVVAGITAIIAAVAGINKYRECRRKCCTEPRKRVLRVRRNGPKK